VETPRVIRLSAAVTQGLSIEEEIGRSDLMVLPITLTGQGKELSSYAILDSSTVLKRVMNKEWVLEQGLELKPLRQMIKVEGFDGRENEDGPITYYIIMTLRVNDHLEKKLMF
jgi:hypothetical protein